MTTLRKMPNVHYLNDQLQEFKQKSLAFLGQNGNTVWLGKLFY